VVYVGVVMSNATQEDTFFVNQGAALAFEIQRVPHDKPHRITFDGGSAAVADFDRDGALDVAELFGANPSFELRVLHNQTPGGHHLAVKLVGGPTVNREAYGATVRLTVGGRVLLRQLQATTGSLGKSSAVLHFGLGDHTAADHLSIVWPGGATQEVDGPFAADQELTVTQK